MRWPCQTTIQIHLIGILSSQRTCDGCAWVVMLWRSLHTNFWLVGLGFNSVFHFLWTKMISDGWSWRQRQVFPLMGPFENSCFETIRHPYDLNLPVSIQVSLWTLSSVHSDHAGCYTWTIPLLNVGLGVTCSMLGLSKVMITGILDKATLTASCPVTINDSCIFWPNNIYHIYI